MSAADLFALAWPFAAFLAVITAEPRHLPPSDTSDLERARAQFAEAERLAQLVHERTNRR